MCSVRNFSSKLALKSHSWIKPHKCKCNQLCEVWPTRMPPGALEWKHTNQLAKGRLVFKMFHCCPCLLFIHYYFYAKVPTNKQSEYVS